MYLFKLWFSQGVCPVVGLELVPFLILLLNPEKYQYLPSLTLRKKYPFTSSLFSSLVLDVLFYFLWESAPSDSLFVYRQAQVEMKVKCPLILQAPLTVVLILHPLSNFLECKISILDMAGMVHLKVGTCHICCLTANSLLNLLQLVVNSLHCPETALSNMANNLLGTKANHQFRSHFVGLQCF